MKTTIEGADLRSFLSVDPTFDAHGFLARAESVVAIVHAARAAGDLGRARHVLSDDMAARLQAEATALRSAGRHEVYEHVRAVRASILAASSDGGTDRCGARVELEGVAYVADAAGKVVDGSDDARTWAEEWWFQRPTQVTVSTSAILERCPSCGAPADPVAGPTCGFCGKSLGDPSGWVVARITEAAEVPDPAEAVDRGRTAALVVSGVVTLAILGGVFAAVSNAMSTTDAAQERVASAIDDAISGISIPGAPTGEPDGGDQASSGTTVGTGYLTPVSNPRVHAPVNDVAAALAALGPAVGRPLALSSIHVYEDGRIMFEVQAPDDPASADYWTWRGGVVEGPEQGPGHMTPDRFFSPEGIDVTKLEALCNTAIGAAGIADGVIDHPYLVAIAGGPRWYIPVYSESRPTNSKTYRVAPDGTGPEVF